MTKIDWMIFRVNVTSLFFESYTSAICNYNQKTEISTLKHVQNDEHIDNR